MLSDLVTLVVLDVADDHSLHRTIQSGTEAFDRVRVVHLDASTEYVRRDGRPTAVDGTVGVGRNCEAQERQPDLLALVHAGCSDAITDWVLIVAAGEDILGVRPDELAAELADAGPALLVRSVAARRLVPSPAETLGPRLVRRRTSMQTPKVGVGLVGGSLEVTSQLLIGGGGEPPAAGSAAAAWFTDCAAERVRLRAASADLEETTTDAWYLVWAGEYDGALTRALVASRNLGLATEVRGLACRVALAACLAGGRHGLATAICRTWVDLGADDVDALAWSLLGGMVGADAGMTHQAAAALDSRDGSTSSLDPWLRRAAQGWSGASEYRTSFELERGLAALAATTVAEGGELGSVLIDAWFRSGRPMGALFDAWPSRQSALLRKLVEETRLTDPSVWMATAAAYAARRGISHALAARLQQASGDMSDAEAVEWTTRMTEKGLTKFSPLRSRAGNQEIDPTTRVLNAALAVEALQDRSAEPLLRAAAREVPRGSFRDVVVTLDSLAPTTLADFVVAAACTPDRALRMAAVLDELGAAEQAGALRDLAPTLNDPAGRIPDGV